MKKSLFLFSFLVLNAVWAHSQYVFNKENITIVRDTFGVPHIYGKTDADAAYGLAWAHSEDAFQLIQYQLLSGRGRLGEVQGKQGVLFDFARQFFGVDTLVQQRLEQDLSPDYRLLLDAYIQAVNAYAQKHPKEVLLKNSLPFTVQDMIQGFVLKGILWAGAGWDFNAIHKNMLHEAYKPNETGSNAMAIAPHRTEDKKTWLLINSHQPIEGEFAWYEAHINSEEGWNILGGLFPGAASIFVGCNEHLGWAHTTNYHNFGEIYHLKVSKNKKSYFYDNQWIPFQYKKIKLRIKVAGLTIRVSRKVPLSDYGAVFKKKANFYALRYPSAMDIRASEQWFRMNKARNFKEFENALQMEALPLFNVIYGDREGTIFMSSEGMIPQRDSSLNWTRPVLGISSQHKWTNLLPYEEKTRYLNPEAGFVYNCNGTPLKATGYAENSRDSFIGIQLFEYNRHELFGELLNAKKGLFTWQDFLDIKYNKSYRSNGSYQHVFGKMYELDENNYPAIKTSIQALKQWNRSGEADNEQASLALLTHHFAAEALDMPFGYLTIRNIELEEPLLVQSIEKATSFLMKEFKTIQVPLGELQRLERGTISLPMGGLPEVPRAVDSKLDTRKKRFVMQSGDGYFQLAKFSAQGLELETISPFGASTHPESKHYTDQMQLFINQKTKTMSLKKEDVLKSAERIYHPNE